MFNKKIFIFSVVLMSSIFFSGCGVGGFFKDDADITTKVGVLKDKPSDATYDGTHILVDEKDNITPLRSLILNLGSNEYLENKVQVMGFMNTKDDVFEVSGVSVMEVLSKDKTDKDLVSYKNTDLGFEINYPNDWALEDLGDSVVLTAPTLKNETVGKPDVVTILQTPFVFDPTAPNKDSIDDALFAYADKNLPKMADPSSYLNKVGEDLLDALKISRNNNEDVYLYRNGLIYQISFVAGNPTVSEHKNAYNEILSSFKFTGFTSEISDSGDNSEEPSVSEETLPVSDLKFSVFESLPFKFKGEYPAKWYYSGEKASMQGSSYHYSFTETSDGKELIGLDIVSGDLPSGKNLKFGAFECVEIDKGDQIAIYVKVDNHTFLLSGNKQYRDIILLMSSKISSTQGV
ncbi:hypothetical protein M0P48_01110 [Candidatus Gracilibacteria bacterium]|nr:hypothetical protein [Candidatus Gracilibacteria bacterium]